MDSLKAYFERGVAHGHWADIRIYHALQDPAAPDKARRIFAHYLSTLHVWHERAILHRTSAPIWPEPEGFDFISRLDAGYEQLRGLAEGFAEKYSRTFTYQNSQGEIFTSSIEDMLHHVLLHGHYHRGQVNQLLRQAGMTPVQVDFIIYSREK